MQFCGVETTQGGGVFIHIDPLFCADLSPQAQDMSASLLGTVLQAGGLTTCFDPKLDGPEKHILTLEKRLDSGSL